MPLIRQYRFNHKELVIKVDDLLTAPSSVIVNPANSGLSHGGGLAGQISIQGGESIQNESDEIISKLGSLDSGSAVFTQAGHLPYQAIIHAVGPKMGEGSEDDKIHRALTNSFQLCNYHDWPIIALPAISTGMFPVPVSIFSRAFYQAINEHWREHKRSKLNKIMLYLGQQHFEQITDEFSQYIDNDRSETHLICIDKNPTEADESDVSEAEVGYVDLSKENDVEQSADKDIDDWFV